MCCETTDGGTVLEQWSVRLEALLHAEAGSVWGAQPQDDEPTDLRRLFTADQNFKWHAPSLKRPVRKLRASPSQQKSEQTQGALQDAVFQQQLWQLAGQSQLHAADLCSQQQLPVQHCRQVTEPAEFAQGSCHSCSGNRMGDLLHCLTGDSNGLQHDQAALDEASHMLLDASNTSTSLDAVAGSCNGNSISASSSNEPMRSEQQLEVTTQAAADCCSSSSSKVLGGVWPSTSNSSADMIVDGSSIVLELHRLQHTRWGQVAGPIMLSITAYMLVLALLLQLQRTGNRASSTSASLSASTSTSSFLNSSTVLRVLPGLAAVLVSQLKPLQFMSAKLESAYQAHALGSKQVIDVLLSSSWCLLAIGSALRSTHVAQASTVAADVASPPVPVMSFSHSAEDNRLQAWVHAAPEVLHSPWLLLLIAPMIALTCLACIGPRDVYSRWREQLLMLCRLVIVSSGLGITGSVQSTEVPWGLLLLLTTLHALVSATAAVRFSTFVPMQLMQVVALLVGSQGQSVLYCVQLVACGLLVPCAVLLYAEVVMRRGFLAVQLHGGVKSSTGGGSCIC